MKRILCACYAAMLLVLFLSCCGKATAPDEWKDLKNVTDNFTLEDAKRAGYVVIEDGSVTCGEDAWQDFVALSAKKTPCRVRVVHYYNIGDPSHYDPEYYESIKDDYPKMYIFELSYDGNKFVVSHYEEEKLHQSEYKYLMRYEGEAETSDATYASYVRYVLVNDDKVTWSDIFHGMLSSKLGDYIPHSPIYTDLIYKEGEQ